MEQYIFSSTAATIDCPRFQNNGREIAQRLSRVARKKVFVMIATS